jgi:adenylate cyclase
VALDIVFAEPDRYDGTGVSPDAALADTLRTGRVVLGYAFTFDETIKGFDACAQHAVGLAIIRRGDEQPEDPFFRATGAVCSLPILTQAAGASGFLNAAPDPDGVLRRVPLLLDFAGRIYPSLALAAVAATTGTRPITLNVVNVNASSLMLDSASGPKVPLDGKSNLQCAQGPKRTFHYVSAADVLSGQAGADTFRTSLSLSGRQPSARARSSRRSTLFAGVEFSHSGR